MLWTLFTIVTSLTTLYCLVSPTWLHGYERPYGKTLRSIIVNDTSSSQQLEAAAARPSNEVEYYSPKRFKSNLYQPTIGKLKLRCLRFKSSLMVFFES